MKKLMAALVMVLSLSLAFAGVSLGAEKTVDPKTLENRKACIDYVNTLPKGEELMMFTGGMSLKGCSYSQNEACKALATAGDRDGMKMVGVTGEMRRRQLDKKR